MLSIKYGHARWVVIIVNYKSILRAPNFGHSSVFVIQVKGNTNENGLFLSTAHPRYMHVDDYYLYTSKDEGNDA